MAPARPALEIGGRACGLQQRPGRNRITTPALWPEATVDPGFDVLRQRARIGRERRGAAPPGDRKAGPDLTPNLEFPAAVPAAGGQGMELCEAPLRQRIATKGLAVRQAVGLPDRAQGPVEWLLVGNGESSSRAGNGAAVPHAAAVRGIPWTQPFPLSSEVAPPSVKCWNKEPVGQQLETTTGEPQRLDEDQLVLVVPAQIRGAAGLMAAPGAGVRLTLVNHAIGNPGAPATGLGFGPDGIQLADRGRDAHRTTRGWRAFVLFPQQAGVGVLYATPDLPRTVAGADPAEEIAGSRALVLVGGRRAHFLFRGRRKRAGDVVTEPDFGERKQPEALYRTACACRATSPKGVTP